MPLPRTSSLGNRSIDPVKVEEGFPHDTSQPPNQVIWDSDNEPHNPVNWKASLKWKNLGIISSMSFVT